MANYQHKKGVIQDNALQALLHDPLFRQRIEHNQKGKGSYRRKEKHAKSSYQKVGDKTIATVFLSPTFCLSKPMSSVFFSIASYQVCVFLFVLGFDRGWSGVIVECNH